MKDKTIKLLLGVMGSNRVLPVRIAVKRDCKLGSGAVSIRPNNREPGSDRHHLPAEVEEGFVSAIFGGIIIVVLAVGGLLTFLFLLHKTKLVPGLFESPSDGISIDPDTLPAKEILVRGSSDPAPPHKTLLRAAHSSGETPQEELLRALTTNGRKD